MISYFIIAVIIVTVISIVSKVIGKATETPLMKAAAAGDVDSIKELLSEGADINEQNSLKNSALSLAIIKNQEEAASVLINEGANLTMACQDGKDAFDLVLESKNERILLQLIEKIDTNTLVQLNLLAVVGKNFSVEALRGLFNKIEKEQKGVFAKIREGNKYSDIDWALWKAAENGNIQNVDFLLEKGASLTTEPIWAASANGSLPLVKKFIELGDNIEAKDKDGNTCLAIAVINFNNAVAELLLEHNANPNIMVVHNGGKYPLMFYAKAEGSLLVPTLEEYGATSKRELWTDEIKNKAK